VSEHRCRHCLSLSLLDPFRRSDAEFCTPACKMRAYRRRQQGVDEDAPPLSLGVNAGGVTLAEYYLGEKQENVTALEGLAR